MIQCSENKAVNTHTVTVSAVDVPYFSNQNSLFAHFAGTISAKLQHSFRGGHNLYELISVVEMEKTPIIK